MKETNRNTGTGTLYQLRIMTITCINSSCQTQISAPEDISFVICPNCGEFNQIPYSDSLGFHPAGSGPYDGYSSDLEPFPPKVGIDDDMPSPFPKSTPDYPDAVFPPNHQDSNYFGFPASEQAVSPPKVGFLILQDGHRIQLKEGQNIIGRKCGELSVDDMTVSRRHCMIEVSLGPTGHAWHYTICDIGAIEERASTNGVFISGRSLRLRNDEKIPLREGSIITLGGSSMTLRY